MAVAAPGGTKSPPAGEVGPSCSAERARQTTNVSAGLPLNMALVSPGSGEVRWPILNFTLGRGLWDSGYHQGVDLLASCGEPLYAAAAGNVSVSQESYGGYGVAVSIDHGVDTPGPLAADEERALVAKRHLAGVWHRVGVDVDGEPRRQLDLIKWRLSSSLRG